MTEQNWRAARRARLWERLCRLSDELQELTLLWWDEDPELAGWDPDDTDEPTRNTAPTPRNRQPKRQRR